MHQMVSNAESMCADERSQDRLQDQRSDEEHSHLKVVSDVSDYCHQDDAGFGFEDPKEAVSWKTTTIDSMSAEIFKDAICNRCQTGLVCRDNEVHQALDLPCQCGPNEHVPMEGKARALKSMQNYEKGFVKIAAKAIHQEMVSSWKKREIAKIMVSEELDEMELNEEKQK